MSDVRLYIGLDVRSYVGLDARSYVESTLSLQVYVRVQCVV